MTMQLEFAVLGCVLFSACGSLQAKNAYQDDIQNAFDEHCRYFTSRMRVQLTKDARGFSDTYVLYNVQTNMQNAAIYADEQGNTEILTELLKLCSIPFEPQYMTKGKWLNNSNGLVGVEVDLVLSQYFSLLTRVLSACKRHGIPTHFSDANIDIVNDHIDLWFSKTVNRSRVDDRHMFFVQSALQFYDYLSQSQKQSKKFSSWKQYVQDYMKKSIAPKWEMITHTHEGKRYDCWMLDRTGWAKYQDYNYAGYGSEITKSNSDTDPKAMFDSKGIVKQPKKPLEKVGTDVSHARRFNWFFETIKRFGKPFDVSIRDEVLIGWANNLAYRVCRGTVKEPHFTVFSDGVDGWYRVGYSRRKGFGYTLGGMDLHFVASSYGFFGV
ncbi:MAG: hypothetical protein KAI66_06420, partial [Lentisphaeria bacterium]|nr:hypothetical protein [Lentisphaeria bacterium]